MLSTSHGRPVVRSSLHAVALAVGLLTTLAATALAQTYYVDPSVATCSALATGTELDPYCTIAQAMAAHKGPGITIVVKPGIYREQVTVPLAGAAGTPFVFQASGPGVVIDGSDDFHDAALWVLAAGTTFRAAGVTWTPKQVFVDGARLAASTASPDLMPSGSFRWVTGEGLYVNLGGDNPGAHATLVGHRNYGFNIFTKSFVNIDGFEIAHTEDRGINIQNGCTDLVISHNRVSFANSYGIQTVNGQRLVIDGNVVSDCNFHGIGLINGASACVVSNNECFRNAFPASRQANGIYLSTAPGNTIFGNKLHDNQDTGLHFALGSNDNVSYNNCSWYNGDHGYDHLGSSGISHRNDVAYANYLDGFSFEGNAPGGSVFNCISVDNGITNGIGRDLWVDLASSVGFSSDHNILWNSTAYMVAKWIDTSYALLSDYKAASGQDTVSVQADPLFANAGAADFHLTTGSPAIDAASSAVAFWPALDAAGGARIDDLKVLDTGVGPVTFADIGAFEFLPPADVAPVVVSPSMVKAAKGSTVTFDVTASDPDGDPILSLSMVEVRMPPGSGATFTPNATNTGGTFSWYTGTNTGNFQVRFVATNLLTGSSSTNIQIKAHGKVFAMEGLDNGAAPVLALSNAFPNPSSGAMDFALDLPEASDVDFAVFDMQGRRVWSEARSLAAGRTQLRWSGLTLAGSRANTGIYFVRVRVGDKELSRRVIRF